MTLSGEGRWYGFVYQDESSEDVPGPRLLKLELVEAGWFDGFWASLVDDPDRRELERLAPNLAMVDFATAYAKLPPDRRSAIRRLHKQFTAYMNVQGDLARVALLEVMVSDTTGGLGEGAWVQVKLGPGKLLKPLRNVTEEDEAIFSELGLTPATDALPTLHRIEGFGWPGAGPRESLGPILSALHFPQVEATNEEDPGAPPHTPPGETPAYVHVGTVTSPIQRPVEEIHKWRKYSTKVVEVETEVVVRVGRGGVHGMAQPAAPAPLPSATAASRPRPGQTPVPTYQRFVGAHAVGSANTISVWNDAGTVAAYVDFGYPLAWNRNTYPAGTPYPCVCSDPLIVLSHWDYDHLSMARYVREAFRRRWIAPQQVIGSASMREVYINLLRESANGGGTIPVGAGPYGPCSYGFWLHRSRDRFSS